MPKTFKLISRGIYRIGSGRRIHIQLKPDAQPFTLCSEKLEEEMNFMEKEGVISKVDNPTPWCAGQGWW